MRDAGSGDPAQAGQQADLEGLLLLVEKVRTHLAERLARECATTGDQVRRLYELALGRPATEREVELLTAHTAKFGMANWAGWCGPVWLNGRARTTSRPGAQVYW